MTIAEVNRAVESYIRVTKSKAKEKATMDYIQAQLIIAGISRSLNGGKDDFPVIEEVYPSLFVEELQNREKLQQELSILRFKQYAEYHNNKIKTEGGNKD